MRYSIVLSTQPASFQAATFKGDLGQNLKQIAGLGYNGVELAIRDPRDLDLDSLHKKIISSKLAVPAIGTGQAWGEEGLSFTDPDSEIRKAAIERVKNHILVAARFGAIIIIGLIRGIVKPGVTVEQADDMLMDALVQCCTAAQTNGIRLAIEPINRYETTLLNTVSQGLDLIEKIGLDNFGLLLDTFHMNIEEPNMEASILSSGNRIFHFHVADSNRHHPGAGHLDFKSILGTLRKTGYRGWISGEFLPIPDAGTAAGNNLSFIKQCLHE
jgi:sugar phosphate isomerase/epimerase